MRLSCIRVKNFRSLRNVVVDVGVHTALIGGNGAGKSSVLNALDKFYSTKRSLDIDDFYARDQTEPVEIELTFDQLSRAALDHFGDRVREGRLVVTRVFDATPASGRYYGSVMQNPDFAPIRAQTNANPKREAYNQIRHENPSYADLPAAASAGAVDANLITWEEAHPDRLVLSRDDGQFFGFQNASRGALQRFTTFVFIPAVREAAADAADGKGSPISRLLELIVRSAILQRADIREFQQQTAARYQELVSAVNMPELGQLADQLTTDIRGLYKDAAVGLSWKDIADFPFPLPVADVALSDDGFGGPVDRQGHGLQRAFVITLLQHLARTSSVSSSLNVDGDLEEAAEDREVPSLILAIEEPELYQHPTKQRHFANVLRNLSAGTLPGQEGPTQVIFASHSPMFVSMARPDEIRLARRTECEDGDYKQCQLRRLDLSVVATRLGAAQQAEPGSYTAETLAPRLHILGLELAEGFFANGVVLVEGRSDKAAITAVARLLGVSFESAGIAVLSAEGKDNIDRPFLIFDELGIPTFPLWDCDIGTKDHSPAKDVALLRLCMPGAENPQPPNGTQIGDRFACFERNLESALQADLTDELFCSCLTAVGASLGLSKRSAAQKIPEVMFRMLELAQQKGAEPTTLISIVQAIWRYFTGDEIAGAVPEDAAISVA